jgi:benzodiazapine receptor
MVSRPIRPMTAAEKPAPDWRDIWSALVAVVAVGAASRVAQVATFPNFSDWWEGLPKPWFTPPDVVFGYVWGPLYLFMALAFWRIRSLPAKTPGRDRAIALFLVQLTLNALWTVAFFRVESPGLGLLDIGLQLIALAATIGVFWPLDRWAALALVPLAAWVGFVAVLDAAIWRLGA